MPCDDEPGGAAPERTALAWERAAYSYVLVAAVVLSVAAHRHAPWLLGASAVLLVVAALVWRHARRPRSGAGSARTLALLAATTALAAVLAAVAVLVPR
ncbi:MAG: hypothetical protein QOJ82_85 [Solirubrobacteraceae bacterium]|jgi:uncharacterized membrane protein YidH (DUF202 family)|nr:hypothetical protein [Solirubrobacteraceae bacterium]MEA2392194.1 hypothetical protein [Solirubrobacteraceae bacterium]